MITPARFLDITMATMSSAKRPLDFALIQRYPRTEINLQQLETGAEQARKIFPITGSIFSKHKWHSRPDQKLVIHFASVDNAAAKEKIISDFIIFN